MKIAILTPTYSCFSGPDRVAENEAKEYAAEGHEVTVFTFRGDIKASGYSIVQLGMPKNATLERIYRLLFFADIFKVVKAVNRLRDYDKVVSFLYPMTILAANAKKKYGKRYTYYNVGVAHAGLFSNVFEKLYMRLFNALTNFTVRNADDAVSISKFLADELKKETGLNSSVKHVKVDSNKYNKKLSKSKIAAVVEKHKLSRPIILYVGRISPHKGIHLLLKAFRIVKEKIPNATLVVVGKHTFGKYSKQLQKNRGGVVFTGFVPDEELPYYFGACDVYATASLWEGFDIPAVQAQMCGKEVVAFDVGSHPEVVNKGILVRPGDVKGFADAIAKILRK
ncbi:glycosyltransferase family 4 protein [Candidatus Woesearchaeota archaeon]|nr:glycosyltransferase family 4 protein [Candidatus Woesearchaeota archaeon]